MEERKNQDQLIPFLMLRKSIGYSGIFFPILLLLGTYLVGDCKLILGALSDYYHTIVRDIFVSTLSILSVFLFSYRGPEAQDDWLANLAGLSALGIAFFPTDVKECNQWDAYENPVMHNISAVLFFLVLTYFCFFLFTKSNPSKKTTPEKIARNKIYRICGWLMLAALAFAALDMFWLKELAFFQEIPVLLLCEWVALWAFGFSWIVKGGAILTDSKT